MALTSLLLVLASVVFVSTLSSTVQPPKSPNSCVGAARACRFRFFGTELIPTISVCGPFDRAVSPRIVSKRPEILGVLNSNNIPAEALHGSFFRPISFLPVHPPLTPTHIKPFSIPHRPWSGIGFQTLTKSQQNVLKGKCIRVFFTHYQVLNKYGDVIQNVNDAPKFKNRCVVFRAS